MDKEVQEKFINVAEELKEKHKTFTDEEIIQLTDWKMEEAKLSGFDEGTKIGTENGIKYTIINMLKENLDIKLISKITGLKEEEIIELEKTL